MRFNTLGTAGNLNLNFKTPQPTRLPGLPRFGWHGYIHAAILQNALDTLYEDTKQTTSKFLTLHDWRQNQSTAIAGDILSDVLYAGASHSQEFWPTSLPDDNTTFALEFARALGFPAAPTLQEAETLLSEAERKRWEGQNIEKITVNPSTPCIINNVTRLYHLLLKHLRLLLEAPPEGRKSRLETNIGELEKDSLKAVVRQEYLKTFFHNLGRMAHLIEDSAIPFHANVKGLMNWSLPWDTETKTHPFLEGQVVTTQNEVETLLVTQNPQLPEGETLNAKTLATYLARETKATSLQLWQLVKITREVENTGLEPAQKTALLKKRLHPLVKQQITDSRNRVIAVFRALFQEALQPPEHANRQQLLATNA